MSLQVVCCHLINVFRTLCACAILKRYFSNKSVLVGVITIFDNDPSLNVDKDDDFYIQHSISIIQIKNHCMLHRRAAGANGDGSRYEWYHNVNRVKMVILCMFLYCQYGFASNLIDIMANETTKNIHQEWRIFFYFFPFHFLIVCFEIRVFQCVHRCLSTMKWNMMYSSEHLFCEDDFSWYVSTIGTASV